MFPEFGDLAFPFVCASASGRVGLVYTVLQDALASYTAGIFRHNAGAEQLLPEVSEGLQVLIATFSLSGTLVDHGWVRAGAGFVVGTSCAIDDSGMIVAAGLAESATIRAENRPGGPSLSRTFTFNGNETFGWLAAFTPTMAPSAVGAMGSSVAGSKNGINVVALSADGTAIYAAGVSEGAISVASTADLIVRTLVQDLPPSEAIARGVFIELDLGLRLEGGSRVRGASDSWIQTIVDNGDEVLVSGGGRDVDWGAIFYTDDVNNYFVGSVLKASRTPSWGIPLAPVASAISGDFTAEAFELQTVSACPGAGGDVFVAGTAVQTVELGWSSQTTISPTATSAGFVGRLNSAGELVCTFE